MPEASLETMATDDDLVCLAREGDLSAREELFRKHWDAAFKVSFRLLGNQQDSQDATQEGMIKALTHLSDFDGRSTFRTWLFRIMTNAAHDARRRRKRRFTFGFSLGSDDQDDSGIEPAVQHDPTQNLRRHDLRQILNGALDRVPHKQREAFVLHVEAGLTYQEVAEVQDVPIGTVMSRIHNARSKLQSFLGDVDGL